MADHHWCWPASMLWRCAAYNPTYSCQMPARARVKQSGVICSISSLHPSDLALRLFKMPAGLYSAPGCSSSSSANSFLGPRRTYVDSIARVKSRIDHACRPQSLLTNVVFQNSAAHLAVASRTMLRATSCSKMDSDVSRKRIGH